MRLSVFRKGSNLTFAQRSLNCGTTVYTRRSATFSTAFHTQSPNFSSFLFIFYVFIFFWFPSLHDFRGLLLLQFVGVYCNILFAHLLLSILFMWPNQTSCLHSYFIRDIFLNVCPLFVLIWINLNTKMLLKLSYCIHKKHFSTYSTMNVFDYIPDIRMFLVTVSQRFYVNG